jgi:hypothetical protein
MMSEILTVVTFILQGHAVAQLVEAPMVSLEFFLDTPFCRTTALGSTQPLTKISTRNTSWG